MKNIAIAGRTGKDAVLRKTDSGDNVLGFSVAVDDGWGERKSTMWFDCSVWGKRAESLEPHMKKGTAVSVSGELGKREHEGKTYLTVRVNDLTMQGGGEKQPGANPAAEQPGMSAYASKEDRQRDRSSYGTDLDDEIPF